MDRKLFSLLKQVYEGKALFSHEESENFKSVVNRLRELRRCNFLKFSDKQIIKHPGGISGNIYYKVVNVEITYKGEEIIEAGLLVPDITNTIGDILTNEGFIECRDNFERALTNLAKDPHQSIASASSTMESIFKAILDKKDKAYKGNENIQDLLKQVYTVLKIAPDTASFAEIKRIENGLLNVALGVGVIRSKYSPAHGKSDKQHTLNRCHARLAINAISTVGLFLLDCYLETKNAL